MTVLSLETPHFVDLEELDEGPVLPETITALGHSALARVDAEALEAFALQITPPQGLAVEAPFNSAVSMPEAAFQSKASM